MQDLTLLAKKGYSTKSLESLFCADVLADGPKRLTEIHSARLRHAINTNILEAPLYGAIDRALEAAQKNVPYLQARELADSGKSHEEIVQAFRSFQLEKMLEPVLDPVTGDEVKNPKDGKPLLTFNRPIFEKVFLPLVAAYCEVRAAKIYNDLNGYPRYKYSPNRMAMRDLLVSDIVTSRIQRMAQDMGYSEDDKQSIKQLCWYGICFNFPKEAYHREQYDTLVDGKEETKTLREGVRFAIPHPRRHFWDRSCPAYTFNSDTGVSFAGYWDIVKFSDIADSPSFWNKAKITHGGYSLFTTPQWKVYQEFYPCTVAVPSAFMDPTANSSLDRIDQERIVLKDERDAPVTLAVMYDKIVPKQFGLFDYDKPVWMRFVYANLDTCIWAEVMPYTPGCVYLDRYDANKTVPSSLGLTLAPFQQLLGNFVQQHFLAVKQNLLRISFINEDIVPKDQISLIRKLKEKIYDGFQLFGYSKKRDSFLEADRREAITTVGVPQVDTQQTLSNVNLTLMALERMLGFSAQEVGAAASHEQTAQEVCLRDAAGSAEGRRC